MQNEGECSLFALCAQNRGHVVIGTAAVNDERQLRSPCRLDMADEAGLLVFRLLRVVEVIQTRLADRHDLVVALRQPHQIISRDIQFLGRAVGMRADRAEDRRIFFRDLQKFGQPAHPGRDRHHLADTRSMGAGDDIVALSLEIGKIQMAMGIDQHGCRLHASGAT